MRTLPRPLPLPRLIVIFILCSGTAHSQTPEHHQDVVLLQDTAVVFRLSDSVSSDSEQGLTPKLEVVQDVKIGDFVVVSKGTTINYSMDKQSPGDQTSPGVVVLEFKSVRSIAGNDIPLTGAEAAAGAKNAKVDSSSCEEVLCAGLGYLLEHVLKGEQAKIPQNYLMAAYVRYDVKFDTAILQTLNSDLAYKRHVVPNRTGQPARLHFYYNVISAPKYAQSDPIPGAGLQVDGLKIGTLKPWHYACIDLTGGVHTLRIAKELSQVNLFPGTEYFIRVQRDAANILLDVTNGFEIYDRPLLPGHFKAEYDIDCWNSPK